MIALVSNDGSAKSPVGIRLLTNGGIVICSVMWPA